MTWDGWASLGGELQSSPLVVRNADGRLELFGTSGGGQGPQLAHAWQTSPNGAWSSWSSLGPPPAQFLGAIGVAANADGRLEAFGRVGLMSSGALFHIWQTSPNDGWSAWSSLGGGIGPQFLLVAANADGRLEVFAVGTGPGNLDHIWQTSPGGGWSGWSSLGSLPGGFPVQLAVGTNADGRLELFNTGSGGLWHQWQTSPGGGWSGWNALGAPSGVTLSGVCVGTNADGRLEVFASGQTALWHIWQTTPNGGWSTWADLGNPGTATLATPTVATNADGRLEVFVAGQNDALFHLWQTAPNNGWSGWDTLGGDPASTPVVGTNADGRLEVFAIGRASPSQVWHRWQLTPGGAWSAFAQDWQQTSLAGPAHRLYTTTSDAVLVRTDAGLFRSQDGGATWSQLGLPGSPGVVEVDPTAAGQVLYAASPAGLNKSTDAGASWSLVLPTPTSAVLCVACSQASSSVIYAAIGQGSGEYTFQRSTNAGASWTVLEDVPHGDLCTWTCFLLKAHPLDAQRAFRTIACVAGRNVPSGLALQQTTNQGASWSDIFHPLLYPSRLVGGWGSDPRRFYLGAYLAAPPGGGTYYRSDDDAATWTAVLTLAAGESVGGLAYHPAAPDQVYVGLNTGVVKSSPDGGLSWADLGRAGLGGIEDLALSYDQGILFAASNLGVWRLFV